MSHSEMDLLPGLAAALTEGVRLTPSERAEVLRIAQAYASKDSAAALGLSPATIRERRKRIYRKLRLTGADDLISALLGRSLRALAAPSAEPRPRVPDRAASEPEASARLGS